MVFSTEIVGATARFLALRRCSKPSVLHVRFLAITGLLGVSWEVRSLPTSLFIKDQNFHLNYCHPFFKIQSLVLISYVIASNASGDGVEQD